MSPANIARAKTLWWIACAAQAFVTVVEMIERDYLKAASAACLSLTFLMLATGFTGDGPEKPFWRKAVLFIFVAASIGLLVYRIAVGRLVS
jgi:uncharacterized membrane protein